VSPTIPRDLGDITSDWLTVVLESGGVSGGAIVTGYSAETIAEGTGFVNQLFRLRLDYDPGVPDLPSTIIVKLPGSE
jgi:hypothetical protein